MKPIPVPGNDELLSTLEGVEIGSPHLAEVRYRLDRVIGAGTYSVAVFAQRYGPEGESPVVLKLMRPRSIRQWGEAAALVVQKERLALARLNGHVPPTPFVVRLFDEGLLWVRYGGQELGLPWLALEYVHGGVEGTTLEERIDYSVEQTGYAFEAERAALVTECLASGLDTIHRVGVVHRDLTPWNVLCCGFGTEEIFKISDFGIARPGGEAGTFAGSPGGTVGYAPPEQVGPRPGEVGPGSDIFSFGAIIFRVLTGESYFLADTVIESVLLAQEPARRSILECTALHPQIRENISLCNEIDAALCRATAADPRDRPHTSWELASEMVRGLRAAASENQGRRRRLESFNDPSRTIRYGWCWRIRQNPGSARRVRSVAWEADGSCFAATKKGVAFWDGTHWEDKPAPPQLSGIHFVHRVTAGQWLLGGDEASIAQYSRQGVSGNVQAMDRAVIFTHASGDIGDLAVLVGVREGQAPLLYALASNRWLKPAALDGVARVSALSRLGSDRWLLSGKDGEGGGFAAIYSPLFFETERLPAPATDSYQSCAAQPDLDLGAAVGTHGRALLLLEGKPVEAVVDGEPSLTAVAIDVAGRVWAGGEGSLWVHQAGSLGAWIKVWTDPTWRSPFVSIFADVGLIIAMTADGAIVEGRYQG